MEIASIYALERRGIGNLSALPTVCEHLTSRIIDCDFNTLGIFYSSPAGFDYPHLSLASLAILATLKLFPIYWLRKHRMVNNYYRELLESRTKRRAERLMCVCAVAALSFFGGIYLAAFTFAHLQ